MEITWLGHSCFRLRERDTVVVTDPYGKETGYTRPPIRADVITISHDHPGHNNQVGFRGEHKVFSAPGEYEVKGVFVTGIGTFHDARSGAARGPNVVFLFDFDGLTVCHLGDLGHVLSQGQVEALGDVDILLVPVGAVHTLSLSQVSEVISQIEPRLVIPMHYRTKAEKAKLDGVDKFFKELGVTPPPVQPELKITKSGLPEETQFVLLDYEKSA